ncbi:organic cation transporter 1-like [Ixodes scapularis]|uniref:organic cation transporter 1-like n=1 Tax=Ixodes scapularis TaxID=6945 RepID=UPI001A9E6295|nr:organic cation transporter 1-like [Ixodes scapularis]
MDFEEALKSVGGYGVFNKVILNALLVISTWHAAFCYMGNLLAHVTPPSQWCFQNDVNASIVDVTSLPRGKCQMMFPSEDGSYMNATMSGGDAMTCPTGWRYDNTEFLTTVTMENQWVCGESRKMYAVHTAYWVGSMTGNLIAGYFSDRIGRKKIFMMLTMIGALGNVLGVFFTGFRSFVALRFFTGMGSEAVSGTAFIIVMEYTVCERRTLVSFIRAVSWTLMVSVLPWYAYLLQSWRGVMLTNTAVDALMVVVMSWVPESSSWLLSVGRKDKALVHFEKIARFNGHTVSQEDLTWRLQVPLSDVNLQSSSDKAVPSFLESSLAVLKSPRIRRRTLLVYVGMFIICLCYNANAMELGRLNENIYASYSLALAFEFPVNLICIVALDTIGRRWPNSLFLLMGAVVALVMGLLRTGSLWGIMVMSALCNMSFAGGVNITYQLASEIFPTVIRGRVVLILSLVCDLGALAGTHVASLVEYDKFLPVLVIGPLSFVAAVCVFLLPDSIRQPLPQTIEDGENFALHQGICFCPAFPEGRLPGHRGTASITTPTASNSPVVVNPPATFKLSTIA